MSLIDLYEHGEQRRNLAHFATLASLAASDGIVSPEEKEILDRFAFKLNITEEEYKEVMKTSNKYPIATPNDSEERLKRLYDFFQLAFADHKIDDEEKRLIQKYAIGLGYAPEQALEIIDKSYAIFSGKINFEQYQYLVKA